MDEEVQADDIPSFIKQNDNTKSLLLDDLEKRHIKYVMNIYNGNQTQSARAMGIALNTLKNKMRDYGISKEEFY